MFNMLPSSSLLALDPANSIEMALISANQRDAHTAADVALQGILSHSEQNLSNLVSHNVQKIIIDTTEPGSILWIVLHLVSRCERDDLLQEVSNIFSTY
jgi:hypothetical protein